MSERTPQDVLRELRRATVDIIEAAKLGARTYASDREEMAYRHGRRAEIASLTRILERLDKAIAEAPDSPPQPDGFWQVSGDNITEAEAREITALLESRPPDRSKDLVVREGITLRWKPLAAPDTLSEKPGLDVERLAKAEHASYERDNDAPRIEWDDLTPNEKAMWRRHAGVRAAEYARLGSTDSEGQ